jgi:release factor glutamine methyltransferase
MLHATGIDNAPQEGRWLAMAAHGGPIPPHGYLEEDDYPRAIALVARRVAGEPLQYVTGVAGFRYLELAVGPGVLIPRPETELVAGRAIELLPASGKLLDLGTGAGPIALAVATERPDATVIATDASEVALGWASRNRDALSAGVELLLGDLFEPLPEGLLGSFDVIVSNPPYVSTNEIEALPRDIVDHEPHDALFAGPDGLSMIRRIAPGAQQWLRNGGALVLEIGADQEGAVVRLMKAAGFLDVVVGRDLAGRPRIAEGKAP